MAVIMLLEHRGSEVRRGGREGGRGPGRGGGRGGKGRREGGQILGGVGGSGYLVSRGQCVIVSYGCHHAPGAQRE